MKARFHRRVIKTCRSAARRFAALIVMAGAAVTAVGAVGPRPSEYAVKAAFIYNFARFVEWPASAFAHPEAPLTLCVVGDDPFGAVLDETVRGKTVARHGFFIRRMSHAADAANCHIVFISRSETARLPKVLAALEGKSVMTIGDMEGAAKRGAVMNFLLEGGRVRFAINTEVAKRAGLNLSSQLIKLSTPITSDGSAP